MKKPTEDQKKRVITAANREILHRADARVMLLLMEMDSHGFYSAMKLINSFCYEAGEFLDAYDTPPEDVDRMKAVLRELGMIAHNASTGRM